MTGDQRLTRGSVTAGGAAAQRLADHPPALFCLGRGQNAALLHWNARLEAFTGRAADQLAEYPFTELLHPDDVEAARRAIARALRDGRADCEARLVDADGTAIAHHITAHPLDASGGACLCVLTLAPTTGKDATTALQADVTLPDAPRQSPHEGEARYHSLVELSPDGVVVSENTVIRFVNPAGLRLVGADSADEVIGRSLLDFVEPSTHARLRQRLEAAAAGATVEPLEYELRRLDGGTAWIEAQARAVPYQGRDALLTVARDVTDRHRGEARYRALFEGAREAIVVSDAASGRIVDANGGAERLFGHPRAHLFDQPHGQFWPVTGQPPDDDEGPRGATVISADGQRTPVEIETTFVQDHAGRLLAQTRFRDLSEVHRRERETRDRYHVLELIARATPLPALVREIANMLERQCPGLRVAILVRDERCLLPPEANEPALDTALFKTGGTDTGPGETAVALPDGLETLWADAPPPGPLQGMPVCDPNDVLLGALVFGPADAAVAPAYDASARNRFAEAIKLAAIAIEQDQLANRLNHQAHHDPLTGLPNRSLLMDRVERAMAGAMRRTQGIALVMLDLDNFKRVNDSMGHAAGDQLLQRVALQLQDCLRGDDTVARLGGDEFVLVLPHTGMDQAARVAEKVLEVLDAPIRIDGEAFATGASIGIALFPDDGTTPEALLQAADTAMYAAKQAGRSRYRFFAETMNRSVTARLRLETDLRQALDQGELAVHYQPRVCPTGGHFLGAEALVRWQHPVHGMLYPRDFLGICSQARLADRLDSWMLRAACAQARAWLAAGHDWRVSVNVSPANMQEPTFVDRLLRTLERSGVAPSALEIEIREHGLVHNTAQLAAQIERLRAGAPGLRIALDGFGPGHSSLAHLRDLALDTLKIDRRFVHDLTGDEHAERTRALLESVLGLAARLGLEVVAEGIETQAQHQAVVALGCRAAQGFYYGGPLTAAGLEGHATAH